MRRGLLRYRHYPMENAERDYKAGRKRRFRVTTINWTIATERGKENPNKVHRNEYSMSLPFLIRWIRDTEEVWEDIIDIKPE